VLALIKKLIKAGFNTFRLLRKSCLIKSPEKLDPFCILDRVNFDQGVMVSRHASVTSSEIGRYTSVGRNTKVTHAKIGSFCAISWDCTINAIFHPISHMTISAFPYAPHVGGFVSKRVQEYKEVVIGHDVWLGAQCIIMPGVSIGDGAIIGAGSVVTKSVAPYEVVCGNPARHLRWRFPEEVRSKLQEIQWWHWSDSQIKENIDLFSRDVDELTLNRMLERSLC